MILLTHRRGPSRCADCAAEVITADNGPARLDHAETCPIAVADRTQRAADFQWLVAHPGTIRNRPTTLGEREALRLAGATRAMVRAARVLVREVNGGRLLIFAINDKPIAASADVPPDGVR